MSSYPYCLPPGLTNDQLKTVTASLSDVDYRNRFNTVSINSLNPYTTFAQNVNNFCQNTDLIKRILNSTSYKFNNILGYNKLTDVTGSSNIFVGTNQSVSNLNTNNTVTIGYNLTPTSDVIQVGVAPGKGLRVNKNAYILADESSTTTINKNAITTISSNVNITGATTISSNVNITGATTISSSFNVSAPVSINKALTVDSNGNLTVNNLILQNTVTTLPSNLDSSNALTVSIGNQTYYIQLYRSGTINPSTTPSYVISTPTTTISEGASVTFTVTTTNVPNNTVLYWSTASIGGSVTSADFTDNLLQGQVTISNNSASITRTLVSDTNIEAEDRFQLLLRTGSTSGPVVATSSGVSIGEPVPTYGISFNSQSALEGSSINFTITTTNIPNNTKLYWSTEVVSGDVQAADFTDNVLTGEITISNNTSAIVRTFITDTLIEGIERFKLQLRTGSATGTIVATSATVTISPPDPFYSVTPSNTTIEEGGTVSFVVTTTNVSNGTVLYWDIESITGNLDSSDFTVFSGQVTITSSNGNFFTQIVTYGTVETNNVFRVRIRTGSSTGTIVATSDNITINDPPTTYTVTSNKRSVGEGSGVRFTVRTANVPNSTVLYWSLSGRQVVGAGPGINLPSDQITSGPTTGSFTINNSIAEVNINNIFVSPSRTDFRYFYFLVRTGSVDGPVVANSDYIIIFQNMAKVFALPGPSNFDLVPTGATSAITWVVGRGGIFGNGSSGTSGGMILKSWNVQGGDSLDFKINNVTGEVGLTVNNVGVSAYGGLPSKDFYKTPTPAPFSVGGRGPYDTQSPIQYGADRPIKECAQCPDVWYGGELVENFNDLNSALILADYPFVRGQSPLPSFPAFGEGGYHTFTTVNGVTNIVDRRIPGIGGGSTIYPASALSGGVVVLYFAS